MSHLEKIQFFCKIRSKTLQNVTCELEKHHLEVAAPERNVSWRTIVHLKHRHVTKSLKIWFKTDFTVKYACKQLKLALVHRHRHTKSDCETTAIEINHTPTKCDLFYVASHKIMIAALGFAKISWSTIQFQFISYRNLCAGQKSCVFTKQSAQTFSVTCCSTMPYLKVEEENRNSVL